MYKLIAIAGTFDRLHKGHQYFIQQAFKLGHKVIIGLTSDKYVDMKLKTQNSKLKTNVSNYEIRKNELGKFLEQEGLLGRAEIVKIDDVYGPAIARGDLQALVVTKETMSGGKKVNEKRKKLELPPLELVEVSFIFAEDKKRIASTRVRWGEIDRLGNVFQSRISENLRQELKKPLGKLIKGNVQNLYQVADKLKEVVRIRNPVIISTVGDEVTKLCNEIGIAINLAIFDFRVGREEKYYTLSDLAFKSTLARGTLASGLVMVKNPAGHITSDLVLAVKNAYLEIINDGQQQIIQVDGEEDLAGVPAILLAPLGAVVLYGQPGEGVVLVEVTEEKKQFLLELLKV